VYRRDIYNATAVLLRAKRQGLSPPEALITRLEAKRAEGKILFEYQRDSREHISMLFLADIRSVEYLNQHSDILLLDCTYKTNKFDMLLLYALGVDNHRNSFTITLCFLDQEIEENYDKAIQYLRTLFQPSLWPSVVTTNCEIALIKAVNKHFLIIRTKRILCY
jgi:hypothetical protein